MRPALVCETARQADVTVPSGSSDRYLTDRRLSGDPNASNSTIQKRSVVEVPSGGDGTPGKRPRGRPKGSRNKNKTN